MTTPHEPTGSDLWTAAELDVIDAAGEVDIATRRVDGTLRPGRTVWIVRHADGGRDAVYVRSVNGADAAWYRGAQTCLAGRLTAGQRRHDVVFVDVTGRRQGRAHGTDERGGGATGIALEDALDQAYRRKYGRGSSAVARITAPPARATTLRVDPA